MFDKCPRCDEERKDDWWVPDSEWKRYVPEELWGSNLCLTCYLTFVGETIVEEGQGFNIKVVMLGPIIIQRVTKKDLV